MNSPGRSVLVFGVYVLLIGLSFLFIPNTLLPIFGFPTTTEVWIRVLGLLAAALRLYYFYSASRNDLPDRDLSAGLAALTGHATAAGG